MFEGGFNNKKFKELLSSFNELLKDHELNKEYKNNNIIKERVELFRCFILNLCHYEFSTYFGREFINTEAKMIGHFDWCFLQTCSDFEDEGFDFSDNDEIYNYFLEYFKHTLYLNENATLEFLQMDWTSLFDYDSNKTRNELETMIEIYGMFDYTIKEITYEIK